MLTCSTCGAQTPSGGRFCSSCGSGLGSADQTSGNLATMEYGPATPTRQSARQTPRSDSTLSSSASGLLTEGRFLPGRLVAGRYRIIALLGRGGMGEVYRADDLTLGQPVALKFLPEEASRDENLLERFKNEVRVARRVSHPNVCRVYDVGEIDGNTFFTMEYVDGEDLASLLRRIGRLPADKALEIARQLCAGLAAAHAKGVLHRDLKPANIMLDGRGQAVVTDFGLAGLAEQIQGADLRSGTPAYMAPEQLEGKAVSVQSDIYSLGLVLYEIFTGKRAFSAEALPDLLRTRNSTPSKPSSLVKDLDPAVERVILRCLEPEPANRPASVMLVAAALPGGDPLAAALAAGETPSPQMVAASGETTGLAPRAALICFVGAILGLLLATYLSIQGSGLERMGLDQPPAVLAQKARELVHKLGYTEKPADAADGFFYDTEFLHYVEKNEKHADWSKILQGQPATLKYWYRQSPREMLASDFHDQLLTPGIVDRNDPPAILSGMVTVNLDAGGRLTMFQAIPPQKEEAPSPPQVIDWQPLFEASGLNMKNFQAASPTWVSLAASDSRMAWSGTWPGGDRTLRVEAASFHGKPVYFLLVGPWTTPSRMQSEQPTTGVKAIQVIFFCIFISVLTGSAFLARRNYKQGRGDRSGSFRLAAIVFGLEFALWLCRAHFVASLGMTLPFVLALSTGLFFAGLTWIMYLALEPYIRRHWPQSIISWSRLLMGKFRDPLVGRDMLFGVILGTIWILIFRLGGVWTARLGDSPDLPSTDFLSGVRETLGACLLHGPASIQATLLFFFMLLLLRIVLRNPWLAGVAFVTIWVALKTLDSNYKSVAILTAILIYGIALVVVMRFGLVALAVGIFTADLLGNVPLTADLSTWYAPHGLFALACVVGLAVWGFYYSLAGKSLLKADLLD